MDSSKTDAKLSEVDEEETYVARVCRCIDACENGEYNSTCRLQPNAKCYRKLELINGQEVESAGCLTSMDLHLDQCNNQADPAFKKPTDLKCCWDEDLCNDHLQMRLPEDNERPDSSSNINIAVALAVSIALAIIVGIIFIFVGRLLFRKREKMRKREVDAQNDTYGLNSKKLRDLVAEYSTPCSSGSGMPLLVQRTIARQIEILHELGRGRYGNVMLGRWREEYVAVKMFYSTEEKSWARETEIYQTVLLRHENILCFVASDINGNGSWTELYLITDYHPNGSLYDYLQNRTLELPYALKLAHSAACGLAHLHMEIIGTQGKIANQGKPAIAHRDIKSKNILVKSDGACCIADMGLAVVFSSSKDDGKGKLDKGHYTTGKQGTKRYMSPEVLSGSLVEESFDAFKSSDVYSFALVLWEILKCTTVQGYDAIGKYRVPYYDVVGNDPDFDEMRKVVDIDNIRPEVASQHSENPVLSRYVEMMMECWTRRPESRLTMLRVRKTLGTLRHGSPQELPPFIPDYRHNTSSAYVSDRSNSSGFPTDNTFDHVKRPLHGQFDSGEFPEIKVGYNFHMNMQNRDLALLGQGYDGSC